MRSRFTRLTAPLLLLCAGVAVSACDQRATPDSAAAPGAVVDSALPIETLLARFRATTLDTPSTLAGGATDANALARDLLRALSANDTASIQRLVVNRAEFAWLYYPHSRFTRAPYEMGPELLWLQMNQASEKGIVRLIRRYGGTSLRFESLACPDTVTTEGPNAITTGCRVRFAVADSAAREMRLFGALMQRDGRWKFVSYANEL